MDAGSSVKPKMEQRAEDVVRELALQGECSRGLYWHFIEASVRAQGKTLLQEPAFCFGQFSPRCTPCHISHINPKLGVRREDKNPCQKRDGQGTWGVSASVPGFTYFPYLRKQQDFSVFIFWRAENLSCSTQPPLCLLPWQETKAKGVPCGGTSYSSVPKISAGMLQGEQKRPNDLLFINQGSQLDQHIHGCICRPNARLQ